MKELSYFEAGQLTPVILLHGFCESKEIWEPIVPELSKVARVIAMDLPGFGKNKPLQSPITILDFAERIFDFLVEKQIRKAIVIGHSMGGYIALSLAEKHPDMIAGLALFHSTALADTAEKQAARDKTINFLKANGMAAFAIGFAASLFYEERKAELIQVIRQVETIISNTAVSSAIEATAAMRDRADRTETLKNARYPVMFVTGKNDHLISFLSLKDQVWLPDRVILHVLNEVAHFGMLEKSKESALILKQFVTLITKADT